MAQRTHTHVEPRKLVLLAVQEWQLGFFELPLLHPPLRRGKSKSHLFSGLHAQPRGREWHLNCQLPSVVNKVPSSPTFCYCLLALRCLCLVLLCRGCPNWRPRILWVHFRHRTWPMKVLCFQLLAWVLVTAGHFIWLCLWVMSQALSLKLLTWPPLREGFCHPLSVLCSNV